MFIRSHATYTFIAAGTWFGLHPIHQYRIEGSVGCYLALVEEKPESKAKARELLDLVPQLLDRKKIGGRDLPTEVFIQKKSERID